MVSIRGLYLSIYMLDSAGCRKEVLLHNAKNFTLIVFHGLPDLSVLLDLVTPDAFAISLID